MNTIEQVDKLLGKKRVDEEDGSPLPTTTIHPYPITIQELTEAIEKVSADCPQAKSYRGVVEKHKGKPNKIVVVDASDMQKMLEHAEPADTPSE